MYEPKIRVKKSVKLYIFNIMTINQLFKNIPPKELIEEIIILCGLTSLDDTKYFSKNDLLVLNTIEKVSEQIDKLKEYYLPCKAKNYLTNLTHKKIITILRQCVKLYGYKIISKEKYLKGEKIIIYQLENTNNKPQTIQNTVCTLTFD